MGDAFAEQGHGLIVIVQKAALQADARVGDDFRHGVQVVVMGVKLKTMELERKAREFSSLRGVFSASVVTGRYDLIVQLQLAEEEGITLLDFFKSELVKISEVQEVETFVVYQSHQLWIPYCI